MGKTLTSHMSSPHTGQWGRLISNETEVKQKSVWGIALLPRVLQAGARLVSQPPVPKGFVMIFLCQ
jgi:hypothetical protein